MAKPRLPQACCDTEISRGQICVKGSILKAIPPLSGIACLLSQGSLTVFNFFVTVHPCEAKTNKRKDNKKKL